MPVESCTEGGKPGFRWGKAGACFTYSRSDKAGQKRAKLKAEKQGVAVAFSKAKAGGRKTPTKGDFHTA